MKKKMLGCLLAAVILPVTLLGGCAGPLVNSDEDLEVVRIVNQQLQDVFVPHYKGKPIIDFSPMKISWNKFSALLRFRDNRFFCVNAGLRRLEEASGLADIMIEGNILRVENYELEANNTYDLTDYYPTRFFQDFLIPVGEFLKDNANDPGIDLFQFAVDPEKITDEAWSQNEAYRADAVTRLNAFFGTTYETDSAPWRLDLKGQYVVVISVDPQKSREENLAALAELDQTEGLSVTGIYYGGTENATLCLPLREDDLVNPETLDPRPSLRVLAANQEIANMLLTSELYGGSEIDFRTWMNRYGIYDSAVSVSPIGACVVAERNSFLTPEMVEAISKVCYRCIDVKLLSRDL